jgi:hypothetical protein
MKLDANKCRHCNLSQIVDGVMRCTVMGCTKALTTNDIENLMKNGHVYKRDKRRTKQVR